MLHQKLDLEKRVVVGNDVRKLRRSGFVPGVIYGNKKEPLNVQVDYNTFLKTYRESGKTHVLDVQVDSKTVPCLVHEVSIDPVKNTIVHFDLLEVNLKQSVTASVPVVITGEAIGVKSNKLILILESSELKVAALPDNVPDSIKIDVTSLENVGDSIKVGDLNTSDKYVIENDESDVLVVLVSQTREEPEEIKTNTIETDIKNEKTDN